MNDSDVVILIRSCDIEKTIEFHASKNCHNWTGIAGRLGGTYQIKTNLKDAVMTVKPSDFGKTL